jgi:hypothetical protein
MLIGTALQGPPKRRIRSQPCDLGLIGWNCAMRMDGRRGCMHCFIAHPTKYARRSAATTRSPRWGGADNAGRNLWFYVCQAGARQFNHKFNDHEIQFMAQVKSILPSSTDQRGNGIAIQLLLQASDTKGSPTVLHESVLTHVCETGDPWVGNSEDVTRAAAYWRDLCLHVPGLNAQDGAGIPSIWLMG